jgi:hypothetical protein
MQFFAVTINIGLDSDIELVHFQTRNECIEYLRKFGLDFNREYHTSMLTISNLFKQFHLSSGDEHCFVDIKERTFGQQYIDNFDS